ncbi:hypothetical protein [Mycobacterium timonense]|uniref:Scaffolding protein n=1 Tax=Mycobacterium timonense TaxID=701043 RepID=A0A7I9YZY9_9MYCO|nr:hypothetical protein [Mycobacterium timonense]GFG94279.1 hypothetical protein MTIM_01580 [Mycobacterium timonense]
MDDETPEVTPDETAEDTATAEGTATEDPGAAEDTAVITDADRALRKLRKENAGLRERAKAAEARAARTDSLAARLHTAQVAATGKLADPADFPYNPDADLLDDSEAFHQAIDELLEAKPHLKSRVPKGDVGQGNRGTTHEPVNFHNVLKQFI